MRQPNLDYKVPERLEREFIFETADILPPNGSGRKSINREKTIRPEYIGHSFPRYRGKRMAENRI